MADAKRILRRIISGYADADKWIGAPFEPIKRLSNTKVGDIGQDFVEILCRELGFDCVFPLDSRGKRVRNSPWDIRIENTTFELKTAMEDTRDTFQFNHIRYHRDYEALLCIGIAPAEIKFDAWSKADVATGKAGHLVTMDKGSSTTHKLTKPRDELMPIEQFEDSILDLLSSFHT